MANEAFRIRIPPSGPDMPAGTPGFVLTVQPNGVDVAPEAPAGPGGSVTPLNAVAVTDAASTAGTPDGAWSGDKAFATVGAAIVALSTFGGGGIPIAPGQYTEVLDASGLSLEMYGLGSAQPLTVNTMTTVLHGSLTIGGSEPSGFVSLRNLQYDGAIDGTGSGGLRTENVICRGPANLATMDSRWSSFGTNPITALGQLTDFQSTFFQAVTVTGNTSARGSTFSNTFTGATVQAEGCTFSAAHFTGVSLLTNCNFAAGALQVDAAATIDNCKFPDATATNLIIGGAGTTTQVNGTTFAGIVEFGDGVFNVYGCTFAKAVATTSPGTLRMYGCIFDTSGSTFSLASAKLFMDAASERNALLAGVDINVVIHALGQDGDALTITSTDATVDFTAQTRGYLKQQTLTANHTFQINTTGNVANTQTWTIDNYNRTANTLTVKDDTGAAIPGGVLGQVAAGEALRYVFGISATTGHAVLISITKLAGV